MAEPEISVEPVPCGICGSHEAQKLFQAPKNSPYRDCGVVRCQSCHTVRTSPRVVLERPSEPYEKTYYSYQQFDPNSLSSQFKALIHKWRLGFLWARTLPFPLKKGAAILDVGCGSGKWLSSLKTARPDLRLFGFELDPKIADLAKSATEGDIHSGDFLKNSWRDKSFDAITFWDVFEHLENPLQILREAHRLLKDDGGLVIFSPNFQSFSSRVFKNHWWPLIYNEHLYHYDRKTLNQIYEKVGFEEVCYSEPRTRFDMSWDIHSLLQDLELDGKQTALNYKLWKLARVFAGPLTRWLPLTPPISFKSYARKIFLNAEKYSEENEPFQKRNPALID